jgi:hypothetical protein
MTQRIYSSRNTFGGNVPPQQKKCPQCERYKEAAFRDAIEFDKFRTMLKIADDMLITLRAENERLTRCCNGDVERERNELRAENERLREALEDIADKYGDVASAEIARAALNRVGESALSAEFSEQSKSRELTADEQKGMEEALRGSGTAPSQQSWQGRISDNERWKSKP